MVKHKGLCPSLKKSVEFDVNEVIELKTKRGTKYQVKGDYEGRTCSTFCSKAKAMELKSALGQTTMSAETEDETGQAHQDESVAPMDNNVQPLSQGQEPMEDMPIQETVATPITGTSVGVEAIDNLQLNDADALANMATQFDDALGMVADFEIAPQEPEGDGRSIGNIRPMNEDVPLHAESEDGTGQAHQEEGVAPIETDVQPLAEGQEPMENMPIQETVATPITNSSVGVEAIDNLQLNDADALANMATQFDEAPEMLADFEISFMQPFGDGQSIGNNTPMNPDVPLHAETFESPIQTVNPMDETTLTTPPPVCFVEKIPPVVWENMSVLEQIEYAETGNESLLSCPQCGITKADLRDAGGYCAVSDPEGSEYISSVDCPYQKHFAPSHWLDEEYVVGHVEGDTVEVSERLPARVDMPKMKNPQKGLETMVVPYFIWDKIYTQFNGGITAEPDLSGLNYTLQFHGMMKPKIKNLIKGAEGNHDIMFGSENYTAKVLKAEGDGGYFIDSATVRPYGAESKKMCIVCNEKPVDYSHPNTLGSLCSTPKCLHYAFSAETFESPATKEVLTLDEAFPSEWFEVPVIAPESGDERYKNCLDCGNPYLVENIRGYGWEASYSNHRPETNGMCDSSLDFEAETFGVEFDDWADQEMLTHGKDVSFKEWAKEEGKKHGDMDLTDWAEHEEESHDKRYGAENDDEITQKMIYNIEQTLDSIWRCGDRDEVSIKHIYYSLGALADGRDWNTQTDYTSMNQQNKVKRKWRKVQAKRDELGIDRFKKLIDATRYEVGSWDLYSAEEEPRAIILYDIVWENDMDLPKGVFISSYDEETLEGHRNEDIRDYLYQRFNHFPQSYKMQYEGLNYGGFDAFEDMKRFPRKYDRRYGAETFESPAQPPQRSHIYQHNGVQYQIKRNSYRPTGNDLMADIDFTNDRGEWIETIETDYHANIDEVHNDAQRIIDEYKDKSDKPSLKSVGLLLGVGALATYFAPKSMRDFLNRLK